MIDLFFQSKYSDISLFPFTEVKDPRKKKFKDYYIQKIESIYSPYINNLCSIPYSGVDEFEELRLYADDNQPEETYKRFIKQFHNDPTTRKIGTHIDIIEAEKKGYYNVLWDVVSTAKKIKDTLIGLFESREFRISADPIDLHSKTLIEDAEMELWTLTENKEFLNAYNQLAGLKNEEADFVPESQDEMDVYKETGGFKPNYAKAMEKAVKYTRDISNWVEIKKSMGADKLTTGWECCQDYYDPEDCMVKTRYIDPATLVIQYCDPKVDPMHKTAEYAGHFLLMNISEVRQWIPDRPEEFYHNLAYSYCGFMGNPAVSAFANYNQTNSYGAYGYEFFKVLVFDAEWIDIDTKKEILFKNRYGKEVSKEVEYDTKVEDFMSDKLKTEDKVERFTDKRRRFGCKWIVGTPEVFDWGPSYDVTRPSKRDVSLTYHVYHYPGKPLMKRLKPLFDQFQILWLKLQNAIAYARNSGGLFNATAIQSVAKTQAEQAAWTKQYLESGFGFFAETNAMTMRNNSMMPFFPDAGGMGKMMEDVRIGILLNIQMIENMTGLNPLALGATPNPQAPVATSEAALAAMSNTLRPYFSGYNTLVKEWGSNVCRWIQLCVRYNPHARKAYAQALGDFDVELMRIAEGDGVQYGINLEALPDDLQKSEVYAQIKEAQQPGQDGSAPRISASDALFLTGMLQGNNTLKNIAFEFSMREKKHLRQQMADKKALIKEQADANDRNAQNAGAITKANQKDAHDQKMAQLQEVNKGLLGKTVVGEGIKKDTQTETATIKSDAAKEIAAKKEPIAAT